MAGINPAMTTETPVSLLRTTISSCRLMRLGE